MASFIIETLPKKEGKNSKLDIPMVEKFQGCLEDILRENSISMEITMWGEEGVSNGN